MAYRCSFLDNEVYTAQDVNNVFSCLTSAGVVFTDTGSSLSDLNTAVAKTVGEGVLADASSCMVVHEDGAYKISPGACFMADGSVIIFDAKGEEISISEGVKNYVYLERNRPANSIDVVVATAAGGENSVPLAEISEDGTITDTRKYAHSKVMLGVADTLKSFTLEFTECTDNSSETITVDIGTGDFSYVIIWGGTYVSQGGTTEKREASTRNLAELTEGTHTKLSIGKGENLYRECVYFKKDGQYLEVHLSNVGEGGKYTLNFSAI